MKRYTRLSAAQAAAIRRKRKQGALLKELAAEYNVCVSAVWWIVVGRSHKPKR